MKNNILTRCIITIGAISIFACNNSVKTANMQGIKEWFKGFFI